MMQQMNKVVLIGLVGNIRSINYGESVLSTLSVATTAYYKDKNGGPIVDTTWHQVETFADATGISKGDAVLVEGRLCNTRYIGADGIEKMSYFVRATIVEKLEDKLTMQAI